MSKQYGIDKATMKAEQEELTMSQKGLAMKNKDKLDKQDVKQDWTPEPWAIDKADDLPLGIIQDSSDGWGICEFPNYTFNGTNPASKANAHRIVQCVNSCAGLTNDEVRRLVPEVKAMYNALIAVYTDIELQNVAGGSNELNVIISDILNRIEKGE